MNELSRAINQVIEDTLAVGNGIAELTNSSASIKGAWEEYEGCPNYDIIGISFYEDDVVKFKYQIEDTKIKYRE